MIPGSVVSVTTIQHPPAGFPQAPRTIGLIALDDGSQIVGTLNAEAAIGDRVHPRVKLMQVNTQGLRIYDVTYEAMQSVLQPSDPFTFSGYIIALTGPSGVGKSTISRILSKALFDYVSPVPIVTTREPKDGDDTEYVYVRREEFQSMRDRGEIAACTRIPSTTEDRWYGYRSSDIHAIWSAEKIPIVVTEMHLLQGLARTFGRRSILSCGLLPPGMSRRAMLSHLLHRLRTRGRDSEQSIADRVRNARSDLDFFDHRKELFDHLLVNDNIDNVVDTLKYHILKTQHGDA